MEEGDAEKMKLKYASAFTDNNDIDNNLKYSIDQERQVESRRFIEIVEGRLEEIVENVWYQVPSEYYDKLLGGLILTGGGSNMKQIEKAFYNHTRIDKIRLAKFVTQTVSGGNEDVKAKNGTMNTVLGLLAKGSINCAGDPIDPNGNLFGQPKQPATPTDRKPRQPHETEQGVVLTSREKAELEAETQRKEQERKAAEEAAKKAAEEEARRKAEEEARIKRENSAWNKFLKKAKKFAGSIMEEEE